MIEDGGGYYLTETQKDIARVHKLDETLLTGLWNQFDNRTKTQAGTVVSWSYKGEKLPQSIAALVIPEFYKRNNQKIDGAGISISVGFSIELAFNLRDLTGNQILLDSRTPDGKGWAVLTTDRKTLEITLHDGQTKSVWSCDEGLLNANQSHHISIIVDGGPKVIAFVVDGVLNDGGEKRQFGWGRFSPYLKSVTGADQTQIGSRLNGTIQQVTIYNRAITISEAIGNHNAYKKTR